MKFCPVQELKQSQEKTKAVQRELNTVLEQVNQLVKEKEEMQARMDKAENQAQV